MHYTVDSVLNLTHSALHDYESGKFTEAGAKERS